MRNNGSNFDEIKEKLFKTYFGGRDYLEAGGEGFVERRGSLMDRRNTKPDRRKVDNDRR